jgi:hypothetical protein
MTTRFKRKRSECRGCGDGKESDGVLLAGWAIISVPKIENQIANCEVVFNVLEPGMYHPLPTDCDVPDFFENLKKWRNKSDSVHRFQIASGVGKSLNKKLVNFLICDKRNSAPDRPPYFDIRHKSWRTPWLRRQLLSPGAAKPGARFSLCRRTINVRHQNSCTMANASRSPRKNMLQAPQI